MPYRSLLLSLLCAALLAAACTDGDDSAPSTTVATTVATTTTQTTEPATTSSSTAATTTPVTTEVAGPPSPVNGVPASDPASIDRRVVAVKIDNHANARPQSGIDYADAVYELLVEAGLTRFIALFQSVDVEYLGPMRSGRPTDVTLVKPLDATVNISGMQPWVRSIWRSEDIYVIEDVRPANFRIDERSAPHNLYANTVLLREEADNLGFPDQPPQPMFTWGEAAGGEPATEINFDWSTHNQITWRWNGLVYARYVGDDPHYQISADGLSQTPIKADTIVVLYGRMYTARPRGSGSSVPATETVGTGTALVFANGMASQGTWSREEIDQPFELTTADGMPMAVPPGRLWIAVFPDHREVTWR